MIDHDRLNAICRRARDLRHALHRQPEIGFDCEDSAERIATPLAAAGLEIHRGLAKSGLVATLSHGDGPAVGLRADMDALPLDELTGLDHASQKPGQMHACGHDGHSAMLLAAALYLAEDPGFEGRVHFVFQPAEENLAGGKTMVDEGLFELFPMRAIYGLHNRPGLAVGAMGVRSGPVMASADFFECRIIGRGAHAAYPHQGADPIVAAAQIICAWQTLVSRLINPMSPAVLSVTRINAGHTTNVIPEHLKMAGTVRAFDEAVQDEIEAGMHRIADGITAAFSAHAEIDYDRRYRATCNSEREAGIALEAMRATEGVTQARYDLPPSMGAEDFGWMLAACPGAYAVIGNGTSGPHGRGLHNPGYDFNDALIPIGAAYWIELARLALRGE